MSSERAISPPPRKKARVDSSNCKRPLLDIPPEHFRCFTWNINGIKSFLQPTQTIRSYFQPVVHSDTLHSIGPRKHSVPSLRDCLKRWRWPQVVCLQEVKMASADSETRRQVSHLVKAPKGSDEPSYRAFFSLPRDRFNAQGFGGKIYGVCTLIREDAWQGDDDAEAVTVEPVDWDLEGRVLVLKAPTLKLTVLNVYAVNGTDNAYRDPKTGEVIGTRHDHKLALHQRLRDFIKAEEQRDWSVVLAGDLNVARSAIDGFPGIRLAPSHVRNRTDFHDRFLKSRREGGLEMCDSFRHLHRHERKYTYRSPAVSWGSSCDRVDLILVSSTLLERDALVEADILDEKAERGPSDHVPSYVTLDLQPRKTRE